MGRFLGLLGSSFVGSVSFLFVVLFRGLDG